MGRLQKVTSSFVRDGLNDACPLFVRELLCWCCCYCCPSWQQSSYTNSRSLSTLVPLVADLGEVNTTEAWQDSLQSRKDRFLSSPRFGSDNKQSVEGEN